jgi:hypothetical protein
MHVELLAAELYLRQGEISQARSAAREALRLARNGRLLQEQALAQRVLGQCACARGAFGEAERLLLLSIHSLEEIEATLELARSRLALAEVQAARARAAGHRPDSRAGELLLQARAAFAACGALWDLAQADRLAAT